MTTHRIHAKPRNYPALVLTSRNYCAIPRTDEDATMQSHPVSAQWRTVEELQRLGWHYDGRDATGRRIIMTKDNMVCRIDEDGQARR